MKPTEEQIKRFWEWCGFRWRSYKSDYRDGIKVKINDAQWEYPDGETHFQLPPIDLNNLFKYAVPKLATVHNRWDNTSSDGLWFRLECVSGVQEYTVNIYTWNEKLVYATPSWQIDKDPALVLFWAIYKVIDGDNTPTKH